MDKNRPKANQPYVVVGQPGKVTFSKENLKQLTDLEALRKKGLLTDPRQISKWQYLYTSYQHFMLSQYNKNVHHDSGKKIPIEKIKKSESKPLIQEDIKNLTPTENTSSASVKQINDKVVNIQNDIKVGLKQETVPLPLPQPVIPVAESVSVTESKPLIELRSPEPKVTPLPADDFTVTINGVVYEVPVVDPNQSLLTFLRSIPGLTGTKKSCAEGGCGACTVMVNDGTSSYSINSCLRPLAACNGYSIMTTEGIGNQKTGLHPVQTRLAQNAGTQCGFCSPGFVMEMYSLLTNNPNPTELEVEQYFDGNICRCTGYRPIFTAFKTFASDYKSQKKCEGDCKKSGAGCKNSCKLSHHYPDIEELKISEPEQREHHIVVHKGNRAPIKQITYQGTQWVTPNTLQQVYQFLSTLPPQTSALVFGHTSWGIYKNYTPSYYIDLQYVNELTGYTINANSITFGSATTIAQFLDLLNTFNNSSQFSPTQKCIFPDLIYLVGRIASHQIRNVASIGGNLMLANKHSFPSDLTIALMGLSATITVGSLLSTVALDIPSFVNRDLTGWLLLSITIPLGQTGQIYRNFKTAQRNVHAHAIVNASCSALVSGKVLNTYPVIAFGNIRKKQALMINTSSYLIGRDLTNPLTLQGAIVTLSGELATDPTIPNPTYRTNLALSFFYKFYLSLIPPGILPATLISATTRFVRPVTQAQQSFTTDPAEFPLNAPIPKLGSDLQTSGNAQYTGDIPVPVGTLHAAYVLSSQPSATITSIDTSAAMAIPGVITFVSAADIPGTNSLYFQLPIFATGSVVYNGQPLGVIVATDEDTARIAAQAVVVNYSNVQPGLYTIQDAIAANSFYPSPFPPMTLGDVDQGLKNSDTVFTGTVSTNGQYHFHLEHHSCIATPGEANEMRLDAATQDTDNMQASVAGALGIPRNKVTVDVKRCGGGYGGKLANSLYVGSACAVAAKKLGLPIKMVLDIDTSLKMLGKRPDYYVEYTVGLLKGKLNAIKATIYMNAGASPTDTSFTAQPLLYTLGTVYNIPNVYYEAKICRTHIAANTSVRGPGWIPANFITEHIIEHAASVLAVAPQDFKRQNFYTKGQSLPDGTKLVYWNMDVIYDQLRSVSNFDARYQEIQQYNQNNKWTKRGIAITPARFGIAWIGSHFSCLLNVYGDGSVEITHAGVEIGQGIDTKVAQTVAYVLGIPLNIISVGRHSSNVTPNATGTGGSITSGLCSTAALQACTELNNRLAPIKAALGPNAAWTDIIQKALGSGVDLQVRGNVFPGTPPNSQIWQYQSYSACVTEVLVDVLTGEHQLLRSDILFDAGISLNPVVDIGQIEGGYVMGLGLFLTEEIQYDNNGSPIQYNTWEYKPLTGFDIPLDFRVTLLKDAPNPAGFLSSKASGEPPLALGSGALMAIQHAIANYRQAAAKDIKNYWINAPASPATTQLSAQIAPSELTF